jgi:hypothetical protein
MNSFKPLLYTFCIITLGSCQSLTFTKKQQDFVTKMSSVLYGAKVTLGKTTTSSTSEGNFKVFEIRIEDLPFDSANADANLLLASSIPAYVFYRDTIEDRKAYKYIDVIVKTNGKQYTDRYTPRQLEQVDGCLGTMAGIIQGLISSNVDSLTWYTDTSLIRRSDLSALAGKMKEADTQWGAVRDKSFKGFRLDETDGKTYILFGFYLQRQSTYHATMVLIDPRTKKAVGFN